MKLIHDLQRLTNSAVSYVPDWFTAIPIRISIFLIFWLSAQTKIVGLTLAGQHFAFWNVTESTLMLFEYEYDLPLIPYQLAAYLATFGEFFLALAVLFGFFTRLSAVGLLIMTAVIQIFVYPEIWQQHLVWAALLIVLIKQGGGSISIDHLLRNK